MNATSVAGRSCPLHYRYRPEDLAQPASLQAEVLYVVGGLYGNGAALDVLLRLVEQEPGVPQIVFNGDFHWFDVDPARFRRVDAVVAGHAATRGNVETELADPDPAADAGCGCAYPDWVDQGVVERSNRILGRLRATARLQPLACERLLSLPMWLRVDVGGARVAVVHGDAESLAGWGFAPEHLAEGAHRARVRGWFDRAGVDLFASSHTCAPVLQTWGAGGVARRAVVNNGAAGMPNLAGAHEGLVTRIAVAPPQAAAVRAARRYGRVVQTAGGPVQVDALALGYDDRRWQQDFLAQWPPGSDAHASYWPRIHGEATRSASFALQHADEPASG